MRGGSPRGTPSCCISLQLKLTAAFQWIARSGLLSGMRVKHVKAWLRGIMEEEDPEGQGNEGKGANWELFVELVQAV